MIGHVSLGKGPFLHLFYEIALVAPKSALTSPLSSLSSSSCHPSSWRFSGSCMRSALSEGVKHGQEDSSWDHIQSATRPRGTKGGDGATALDVGCPRLARCFIWELGVLGRTEQGTRTSPTRQATLGRLDAGHDGGRARRSVAARGPGPHHIAGPRAGIYRMRSPMLGASSEQSAVAGRHMRLRKAMSGSENSECMCVRAHHQPRLWIERT